MEETFIVLMKKNAKTGFLEKEICTLEIKYEKLVLNAYVLEEEEKVVLKLTTHENVEDWAYGAIFDYYDDAIIKEAGATMVEVEGYFNPTWEISFPFVTDVAHLQETINKILTLHDQELQDVYIVIQEHKEAYDQGQPLE